MAGGIHSPQYKCILGNLESLVEHLELNTTTQEKLTRKYVVKKLLPPHAKPKGEELILQMLERIKHDPSQYGEFVAMLQGIEGTDVIVRLLKGECVLLNSVH